MDLLRVSTPARLRNPLAGSRILTGVAWNAAGSAVSQGGSFASSIVAARILGKDTFGQFAMIQSTAVALSLIAGLGLGITATKFVSEYRASNPDKAGRILGLSSLVAWTAAVVFSLAFLIAAPLLAGNLSQPLRLSTPYVFFMTANAYQVGAMGGFEAFRGVSRIQSIYGVVQVVLSWTLSAQ